MTFTVGFDLDMTLIDPRPGMVALFDILAVETGYPLDGQAFVTRLGPPLADEFARYGIVGPAADELVERYRAHYSDVVIPATTLLPGARDAIESVVDRGGSVVVVSGKHTPNVRRHLDALGLSVAAIAGGLWAGEKAEALRAHHTEIYVGDHIGDIAGARAADALAVGVATGPMTRQELADAGADVVLDRLDSFRPWLESYLSVTVH